MLKRLGTPPFIEGGLTLLPAGLNFDGLWSNLDCLPPLDAAP